MPKNSNILFFIFLFAVAITPYARGEQIELGDAEGDSLESLTNTSTTTANGFCSTGLAQETSCIASGKICGGTVTTATKCDYVDEKCTATKTYSYTGTCAGSTGIASLNNCAQSGLTNPVLVGTCAETTSGATKTCSLVKKTQNFSCNTGEDYAGQNGYILVTDCSPTGGDKDSEDACLKRTYQSQKETAAKSCALSAIQTNKCIWVSQPSSL